MEIKDIAYAASNLACNYHPSFLSFVLKEPKSKQQSDKKTSCWLQRTKHIIM